MYQRMGSIKATAYCRDGDIVVKQVWKASMIALWNLVRHRSGLARYFQDLLRQLARERRLRCRQGDWLMHLLLVLANKQTLLFEFVYWSWLVSSVFVPLPVNILWK